MSEERPHYHHEASTPNVEDVLNSQTASAWLKDALRSALLRDPVDAANDAELLASLLARLSNRNG